MEKKKKKKKGFSHGKMKHMGFMYFKGEKIVKEWSIVKKGIIWFSIFELIIVLLAMFNNSIYKGFFIILAVVMGFLLLYSFFIFIGGSIEYRYHKKVIHFLLYFLGDVLIAHKDGRAIDLVPGKIFNSEDVIYKIVPVNSYVIEFYLDDKFDSFIANGLSYYNKKINTDKAELKGINAKRDRLDIEFIL